VPPARHRNCLGRHSNSRRLGCSSSLRSGKCFAGWARQWLRAVLRQPPMWQRRLEVQADKIARVRRNVENAAVWHNQHMVAYVGAKAMKERGRRIRGNRRRSVGQLCLSRSRRASTSARRASAASVNRRVSTRPPLPTAIQAESVRNRLAPGGKWIRTFGSARDRLRFKALSLVGDRASLADTFEQPGFAGTDPRS